MKPKIAVITYNKAFNYGGDLQCFALQYKLNKIGYCTEVLDIIRPIHPMYMHDLEDTAKFKPLFDYEEKFDTLSKIKAKISKLFGSFYTLFFYKTYRKREKVFKDFHEKYIAFSKESFTNFSHLYEFSSKMDYTHYITGSDQVWNYTYPFSIEPYFLSFVKKGIKISYAASIGHSNIPEDIISLYKKWLSDFSFISLREDIGVELIKSITQRQDIYHVLDPTLLLTKYEWVNSLDLNTCEQGTIDQKDKYVLVYLLSRSSYSIDLALEIAKRKSYGVKVISSNLYAPYLKKRNLQFILAEGPKTFVKLFKDAEFIITNSFHGTAFAINFNIPFFTTTRKNKRVNSRFHSLLTICSLTDRLVYENDANIYLPLKEINFEHANASLEKERIKSLSFLQKAIEIS